VGAVPEVRSRTRRLRRRIAARWWQGASGLFMCAVVFYGLAAGGHVQRLTDMLASGTVSAAMRAGFTLQDLTIEGQAHTSREAIVQALGFGVGASMLDIDTAAARARLERLPWVRRAQVMRLLPSSVHVAVEEREPFAVWQLDGKLHLVAADGTVLGTATAEERSTLPYIVGAGAAAKATALFTSLAAYPDLRARTVAAVRVADRRWSLKLDSGLEIRLPEEQIEHALDRLATLQKTHGLLSGDVLFVDLRLPDRVSLHLTDAAAARWSEAQKRGERARDKNGRET
jgi:cell division protein FtsQ